MTAVMVTGVGAIIGYGVLRSLRQSHSDIELVGCDIYDDAVGQAWCDEFVQAPLTSHPDYGQWLESTIARHEIDLVIPAIEQDVDYLSDHRSELIEIPSQFAINAQPLIELGRDKWNMDRELLAAGEQSRIPSLNHGSFETISEELGLPFLLKPRRGYASKGIVFVRDSATFDEHADRLGTELIAQRIIGHDDEEFTVSTFGDGSETLRTISCLRRRLAPDGSTVKAQSVDPHSVTGLMDATKRLTAQFRPVGPTNFQYRVTSDGCYLLEINPRISSSTSLRAAFGYNESAMAVEYYLRDETPSQPELRTGHAARYIEDVVTVDRHSE